MKTFVFGVGTGGVAAAAAALGFLLGRASSPEPGPAAPSLEISSLKRDVAEIKRDLDRQGPRQDVVVKVLLVGETLRVRGAGRSLSTPLGHWFLYRDTLLSFAANLATDSVQYTVFPHRYGLVMGLAGDFAWARAWDITTGDTIGVDSLRVARRGWSWGLWGGALRSPTGAWAPEAGVFLKRGPWGLYARVGEGMGLGILREW